MFEKMHEKLGKFSDTCLEGLRYFETARMNTHASIPYIQTIPSQPDFVWIHSHPSIQNKQIIPS